MRLCCLLDEYILNAIKSADTRHRSEFGLSPRQEEGFGPELSETEVRLQAWACFLALSATPVRS